MNSEFQQPSESTDQPVETIVDVAVVESSETMVYAPLSLGGKLSWLVIILVTVGIFSLIAFGHVETDDGIAPPASSADLLQIQMQGKAIVGQKHLLKQLADSPARPATDTSADEADNPEPANPIPPTVPPTQLPPELDSGPYAQRIAYAILVNELVGADAALEHVELTDQRLNEAGLQRSEAQNRLHEVVTALFNDYTEERWDGPSVSTEDKTWLADTLGWIGELALVPPQSSDVQNRETVTGEATRTLITTGLAMILAMAAIFAGIVILVVLFAMFMNRKLTPRFEHHPSRHNIYVETFALWLVVLFGGQQVLGVALALGGFDGIELSLALMPILFFGSLVVLVWPVIRGIPWNAVRRDIGWKGPKPAAEAGIATISYLGLVPIVGAGFIFTIFLMSQFGQQSSAQDFSNAGGPSHPIQEYLADGNLLVISLVLISACVAAPIVEETAFRGLLYRHLRDWSATHQPVVSIVIASVINGLVFASIHPQGLFGIPLLTSLAIGFSLVREWRDSLLASMFMHGINNFLVTMFMLLVI